MTQLKEIEGRYYQEAEVVMLSNWDITHLFLWERVELVDYLVYTPNKYDTKVANYTGNFQHLYILSDEEIKEGDWYYWEVTKTIQRFKSQIGDNGRTPKKTDGSFKIIATTNESLGLAKPSDSFIKKFIEEYNQGNQITKVLVEYVNNGSEDWSGDDYTGEPIWIDQWQLKVDSNNCITIKKIEPELYTREKVEKLCRNAMFTGQLLGQSPDNETPLGKRFEEISKNWIKENL